MKVFHPIGSQIIQETENPMSQQLTGQIAQQVPSVPITTQKITQQPATDRAEANSEAALEEAIKTTTDELNKKLGKGYNTGRCHQVLGDLQSLEF